MVPPPPAPSTPPKPPTQGRTPRSAALAWTLGVGCALAIGVGVRFWIATTAKATDAGTRAEMPPAPATPPKPTCPATMVEIPGGSFFMGSDEDLPTERPAHRVTVSPFCIGTYEVTTEDYKACVDRGDCKRAGMTNEWDKITDHERKALDPVCNGHDPEDRAKHPINCVDWQMATDYCKAGEERLPTEAEWEFAARGPDGRKYPWGDDPPSAGLLNACGKECVAWASKNRVPQEAAMYPEDDGWPTTAPVGSFPKGASRYGLLDVVGNVWEWVSDWYGPYTNEEGHDPRGPESGESKVIRGGGWNGAYPAWVRPSFHYHANAKNRSHGVGFRCAKSL
jgi:formylglycine-generating enzyme required for sulfatase activity